MNPLRRRTVAPAVAAVLLTLGLSACGSNNDAVVPAATTDNTAPQQQTGAVTGTDSNAAPNASSSDSSQARESFSSDHKLP